MEFVEATGYGWHTRVVGDAGGDAIVEWLHSRGVGRGGLVGLAVRTGVGIGLAVPGGETIHDDRTTLGETIHDVERDLGPRWVWWGRETADVLAAAGVPVGRCWDVTTVHRLLAGVWRTDAAHVWAWLHDLPAGGLPRTGQLDLLTSVPAGASGGDPADPVQPDGYLRPEWADGGWGDSPERLARWAGLALAAAEVQDRRAAARPDAVRTRSTAHAESAAEFLCAELERDGLPLDIATADRLIADAIGPRPTSPADDDRRRAERDDAVLAHAPPGGRPDLRSPADVKALLRRVGFDLPDTRAWRLKQHAGDHPLIAALLTWRKAERIATTYGYRWLDEHVRRDERGWGRLHGEWSSCDGAAGRMTASAGLHNLPAELRPAVAAEPGYAFVHADLGQIEPRVLAAVSGDPALIAATADADLYQPVARRLGVTREQAKLGVLGAMYGGTTGNSGLALVRLRQEYPQAMATLEAAAEQGRRSEPVFTIGSRMVRMWGNEQHDEGDADARLDRARQVAAARGRYARNALIQGAAAEFFKAWAVTFRARGFGAGLDARIVLCLHDEVLIHVAEADAPASATLLTDSLAEAAHRWSPEPAVRFVADVTVVSRWSDAKG
ncbi:MAG TPA: DNA polymerase [Ilumatobacter sp.]|nr:DNA polymerase [Ilumatobacter sp.]